MLINSLKKSNLARNLLASIVFSVVAVQTINSPAIAADDQAFVSKKYDVDGSWQVVEEDGKTLIRFDKSFKTKGGPDLKIFLSPLAIGDVTGKTATKDALQLGELQSTKGTQDYVLPDGVSLEDFKSVLVHCEQYSVLWGGGDLTAALSK